MNYLIAIMLLITSSKLWAGNLTYLSGNYLTMKLSVEELNVLVAGASYDLIDEDYRYARITITRIFPGKGIQAEIEDRADGTLSANKTYYLEEQDRKFVPGPLKKAANKKHKK